MSEPNSPDDASPAEAVAPGGGDPNLETGSKRARRLQFRRPPPVTGTIIVVNIIVAIWMNFQPQPWVSIDNLLAHGATFGPRVDDGEWYRLFTSMFQHAGLLHLSANLLGVYSLGTFLELTFRPTRFLCLYFVAGLAGSVASACVSPHLVGVGASGALFGLLGCLYGVSWRGRNDPDPRVRDVWRSIRRQATFFIVLNLVIGFSFEIVDNSAHIGGLVAGLFFGFFQQRGGTKREGLRRSVIPLTLVVVTSVAAMALLFPWGIGDIHRDFQTIDASEAALTSTLRDGSPRELARTRPILEALQYRYSALGDAFEQQEPQARPPLRRFLRRAAILCSERSAYYEALSAWNQNPDQASYREILDRNFEALRDLGALGPTDAFRGQMEIFRGDDPRK